MPLLPQSIKNRADEIQWITEVEKQSEKFWATFYPKISWLGHFETGVWTSDTAEKKKK